MNERLKQLAIESKLIAPEYNGFDHTRLSISQQKFAELIVKECISINRQRMFLDYEGDSHRVAHNNALLCANSDMFEHFGVGE